MSRAFVIRPFGARTLLSTKVIDFDRVHAEMIEPALVDNDLAGGTTEVIDESGNIHEDMFGLILEADLVICDVSMANPNVYYELGVRHALRKKGTVLIKAKAAADATPFDILTERYLSYDATNPAATKAQLSKVIKDTRLGDRDTDSPVFKMLPKLQEPDPATIGLVPVELAEEIARAKAAKMAGWLRLLASEVKGRRFEWPALRLIGDALLSVKDFAGALSVWNKVQERDRDGLQVNFALANIYERQYRDTHDEGDFAASEQATERVLKNPRTQIRDRVEALSLKGRNIKTRWRTDFELLPDGQRRAAAINRNLLNAWEAYHQAYLLDLNHYWSGLAALQMGTIILDLAGEPSFVNLFNSKKKAADYLEDLRQEIEPLRTCVAKAVDVATSAPNMSEGDQLWGRISNADLLFIADQPSKEALAQRYCDALSTSTRFAWDAAGGQLNLFAKAGVRREIAEHVIEAVNKKLGENPPDALHVIVFAGHRVDEPGRGEPRFPATPAAEDLARKMIRDRFAYHLAAKVPLKVLLSGAPGADILCLEVCDELKIECTVCLPMAQDEYVNSVFGMLDGWRNRFLTLMKRRRPIVLSNRNSLPDWLASEGVNPWERGNRWMLEMARSSQAKDLTLTLMHLWDGKTAGNSPEGTAGMIQLAHGAGNFLFDPIDAKLLLEAK